MTSPSTPDPLQPRVADERDEELNISRRQFSTRSIQLLTATLTAGCGGGADSPAMAAAAPTSRPVPGASKTASMPTAPTPPEPDPLLTTLAYTATTSGPAPYSATLLPLRGELPSTSRLVSEDDALLAYSVLSTWDDGSAAVVVVSGQCNVSDSRSGTIHIRLRTDAAAARAAMTPAQAASVVRSLAIDFGEGRTASVADLSKPERIWWSNAQSICVRYRLAVPSHATLETVFDIQVHASGRALIEVVVENGKVDPTNPVWPAAARYTSATIRANDQVVASGISSAGTPEGYHAEFRGWYAQAWLGGDPGLRVTQSHTYLQHHPLFFKVATASRANLTAYQSDRYTPWSTGRHRATNMGAPGDHPSIGPLPLWETQFLQSGDHRAATAVEASALATLTYGIGYRDRRNGLVPSFTDIGKLDQQVTSPLWPRLRHPQEAATWTVSHHPAAGLMAFVVRPSPVFIEIAQKISVYNGTWSGTQNDFTWTSGTFGHWYQTRGRAWCIRSLTHAIFLTPTGHPWRAAGMTALANNATLLNSWRLSPKARLNAVWDYLPNALNTNTTTGPFLVSLWQHHYLTTEVHKAAAARLLSGTNQTLLSQVADWLALQAVRWVNEQPNGGWRYVLYSTPMGRNATTIDSLPTWGQQMGWWYTNTPARVAGPWMSNDGYPAQTYLGTAVNGSAGAYYPSYFWAALAAATERGVEGAVTAWNTVQQNIEGLDSWLQGFGTDPRWGATPR